MQIRKLKKKEQNIPLMSTLFDNELTLIINNNDNVTMSQNKSNFSIYES